MLHQKVKAYKKLTDVEHVLLRPATYIGSTKPKTGNAWCFDTFTNKMEVKQDITWNPGLLKLFDEIISNSVDESLRSGSHLDTIKVEINKDSGEISILDNGGIIIQMHPEYQEYIPSLVFGSLRTGNNFDDSVDTSVAGQNGFGASLTNIFSTSFTVETGDGKKKFKQTWTENMMKKTDPQIIEVDNKGFTKITFIPDYAHLDTSLDEGNYLKLVKRTVDVAGCNPKLKIYLNGDRIKINSFKDYVGMYVSEFEFEENDDWQVAIAKSDDGFQQVSFVNTTETLEGTHIYYAWYQVATKLREYIKKKHKIDVKQTEIQAHLQIFINAKIVKPRYNSQTKEHLISEVKEWKTSWSPSDKFIDRIIKSEIIQRVLDWAEMKEKAAEMAKLRELNKEVAKGNPRRVEKFSDALESTDRHLCELFLCEGDSARRSIHESRGKNPYIGSFALKGKSLNVSGREDSAVLDNNELKNIMLITGLKIGEPIKSVKNLRFGKIVITTDQDLDGFHIFSLLMNMFNRYWPELFKLGVIYRMNTPLVIASVKNVEHEFMTDADYEKWCETAPRHDTERFKGLGKFKTDRFKKLLENREKYLMRVTEIRSGDTEALSLAFTKSRADDRKVWLQGINYFHETFVEE